MKNINIFILLFISITFFSCEKVLDDVNVPDEGRKAVVNCLFYPDTNFVFELAKSKHILDINDSFPSLTSPKIDIYKENSFLETVLFLFNSLIAFKFLLFIINYYYYFNLYIIPANDNLLEILFSLNNSAK